MNSNLIEELKIKYKAYLQQTEEGRELLFAAVKIKKTWIESKKHFDCQMATKGVNLKFIDDELAERITKMEIIPIGLNNMCHLTTCFFSENQRGFDSRIGLNLMCCPCGKYMAYELHSVNKFQNKLYDFTKDFNEETEKYFLEFNTKLDASTYIEFFGRDPITINKGCKCNFTRRDDDKYLKTEEELINYITMIERVVVHDF